VPRKNFPETVVTVGTTKTVLLTAGSSQTITIRTITAANVSSPLQDVSVTIGYTDSSANSGAGQDHTIAPKQRLPISGTYSSAYTMDIGQVLEPNDILWALSGTANAVDVTGSYEV
jgi:hypothetical protein